jgi:GNAT superfamily N-acetyltransferase
MDASIHVATRADAADVTALLARQFEEHGIALTREALAGAISAILEDEAKGNILLARRDGATVGVACLARTFTLEHGGYVWWLDELYVVPAHRSQGIGAALLGHAINLAKGAGALAIELEIDVEHARAARLYERAGFRALSRARWSLTLA